MDPPARAVQQGTRLRDALPLGADADLGLGVNPVKDDGRAIVKERSVVSAPYAPSLPLPASQAPDSL